MYIVDIDIIYAIKDGGEEWSNWDFKLGNKINLSALSILRDGLL